MSDAPPFVHLHCHSHYSLLDGANRIPQLVSKIKADGMNALALTDHGNLFGAVQFYNECRKQDINPVLGYEAYVAPGHRFTSGLFLSGFKSRVMQANDDLAAIAGEVKQDPALAGTKF